MQTGFLMIPMHYLGEVRDHVDRAVRCLVRDLHDDASVHMQAATEALQNAEESLRREQSAMAFENVDQ